MVNVAVLGGGGTGCYVAGELTLRGYSVCLYEEKKYWHENIDGILEREGIELTGLGVNGFAKIEKITDNLSEAIDGVELIIVCMVAWRHKELAEQLKPIVKDDDVIVMSAGNFGSIVLKHTFGLESKTVVGETMGNMFSCRMVGDGVAVAAGPYKTKSVAAFPAKDNHKVLERFSKFYSCKEAKNVFETALNAPNVTIHLAASLLNTGGIERDPEFKLYRDGLSQGVINCQKVIESEKHKIMAQLGYSSVVHTDYMDDLVQYDKFPELDCFRDLAGPSSMLHRYIVEDVLIGNSVLMRLGDLLGIPTPTVKALIQIARAINGENYFEKGIKLEDLGVTAALPEEINRYLETGDY